MIQSKPKPKTCSVCERSFIPARTMQSVCSPRCAAAKVKNAKKAESDDTKKRKEAIKTIPELIKEAQVEFNRYVRLRDAGKLCICCDRPLEGPAVGGGFDAGHYRSTGSASHLRFNEDNCHGQTKQCNRYGAGRAVDYRIGLIQRVGLAVVEGLESSNAVHKWKADELRSIKAKYRAKANELAKTK